MRISRLRSAVALICCAAGWAGCASYTPLVERDPAPAGPLVVRNVRVFTGVGAECLEARDVFVRDGRIERIDPTDPSRPPPEGIRVLDGTGRTLLPGLVDCHVHVTGSSGPPWDPSLPDVDHNLEAYLYAGVTTVCDLGGDVEDLADLAGELRRGERIGPSLYYAGPMLTPPGGHPVAFVEEILPWPISSFVADRIAHQIEDVEAAACAIDRLAEAGVALVKLVHDDLPPGAPKFSRELLAALIELAHARGLRVAVHVQRASDALEAAELGADALAHGIHRGEMDLSVAAAIARHPIVVMPTLVVPAVFETLAEGRYDPTPLAREIEDPDILATLVEDAGEEMPEVSPGFARFVGEMLERKTEWALRVRALHEAGAPLVAGTDSPIFGLVPGASLHEELRLLVAAGLSPTEALLAATSRAARFLDPDADFGAIEPGRRADLLLVEGDPTTDIRATARIVAVVQGGVVLERSP